MSESRLVGVGDGFLMASRRPVTGPVAIRQKVKANQRSKGDGQ